MLNNEEFEDFIIDFLDSSYSYYKYNFEEYFKLMIDIFDKKKKEYLIILREMQKEC